MVKPNVYLDSGYGLHYPEGASMMDDFPDDLREVVHNHWEAFPPNHPLMTDLFGIVFFILWALSFFGNGVVIIVFLMTKSLRTPTNMFIINLALSDLLMMTTQGLPMPFNAILANGWMFGALGCKVYAFLGGIFGTVSLLSMVVIGYDRYNVIVKGFSGVKITSGKAFLILMAIWIYSVLVTVPPFLGWGGYALEGMLVTCSYDYLSEDLNHRSFVMYAFIFNYCVPMSLVIFFYIQIVGAVVSHEKALKAQAKKMNVESLRSNENTDKDSAEVRIAKVAITNVCLWVVTWTPYATIVVLGVSGQTQLITPISTQLPSFFAKTASAFNPVIFAVSHPKYREALAAKMPCLGIGDKPKKQDTETKMETIKNDA